MASLFLGLSSLVSAVRANPCESDYYLSGFSNLNNDLIRMATVCAISAGVSEVGLGVVLADDRLPLVLPKLDRAEQSRRREIEF